jgi:hypothetical protein
LFSWTFSLCSLDFGISHISSGFTNKSRQQPSPWGEGGESSEPGEGVLDFLTSSFVFIDILALFPRFCSREVETSRSDPPPSGLRSVACGRQWVSSSSTTICPPAHLPTCPCFCTPRLLDCTWRQKPQAGTRKQKRTHNLSGRA